MHEKVSDVMATMPVRVDPETSVGEVAGLMRDQDIGDVLVMEGERLVGIVTDRDIVVRVLADQHGSAAPVGAACTLDPVVVGQEESIDKAVRLMQENKLRRLPVVRDGRVVGIVSLGDVVQVRDPESPLGQISAADPTRCPLVGYGRKIAFERLKSVSMNSVRRIKRRTVHRSCSRQSPTAVPTPPAAADRRAATEAEADEPGHEHDQGDPPEGVDGESDAAQYQRQQEDQKYDTHAMSLLRRAPNTKADGQELSGPPGSPYDR